MQGHRVSQNRQLQQVEAHHPEGIVTEVEADRSLFSPRLDNAGGGFAFALGDGGLASFVVFETASASARD